MGKRYSLYLLECKVEFDDGYFETATLTKVKVKSGRGSQHQAQVAVMTKSTPIEDLDTDNKSTQCRY